MGKQFNSKCNYIMGIRQNYNFVIYSENMKYFHTDFRNSVSVDNNFPVSMLKRGWGQYLMREFRKCFTASLSSQIAATWASVLTTAARNVLCGIPMDVFLVPDLWRWAKPGQRWLFFFFGFRFGPGSAFWTAKSPSKPCVQFVVT